MWQVTSVFDFVLKLIFKLTYLSLKLTFFNLMYQLFFVYNTRLFTGNKQEFVFTPVFNLYIPSFAPN